MSVRIRTIPFRRTRRLSELIGWVIVLMLASCGRSGYERIDPGQSFTYANPAWSPDSTRLAYTRYENYDREKGYKQQSGEIFVMDLTSKQITQLTHNNRRDFQPAWSPDGRQIVYVHEEAAGDSLVVTDSLRILNVDGSKDQVVFVCPFNCGTPDWSPTDNRIAFQMVSSQTISAAQVSLSEVYVIQADGDGLQQLTHGNSPVWWPRWSPDGTRIVFRRAADNPIRVFDLASSAEQTIQMKDVRGADEPSWSPDQSGIVFSAYGARGASRLYFLNLSDGSVKQLLNTDGDFPPDMKEPCWSSDGKRIAFSVFYEKLYLADVAATRAQ